MPLPDERPRASVANLIGRFERVAAVKLPSNPSSPAGSRTASVVRHIMGDAAKMEVKERREWPPKIESLASERVIPTVLASALQAALSQATGQQVKSSIESAALDRSQDASENEKFPAHDAPGEPLKDVPPEVRSDPSTCPEPKNSSTSPTEPTSKSAKAPPRANGSAKKKVAPSKSGPTASARPARPAPPKRTVPARSSQNSPIRQVTGASTRLTTSISRSSLRTNEKASATASRTKAPNTLTTSASTTAASSSRPKTPSSSLYAPTKASLTRAKDAPAPFMPVKKATVPPSTFDRLSKPTAASASKARVPSSTVTSPLSSPPRTVPKPTTARGTTPTPAPRASMKARVTPAPSSTKDKKAGGSTTRKPAIPKARPSAATATYNKAPVESEAKAASPVDSVQNPAQLAVAPDKDTATDNAITSDLFGRVVSYEVASVHEDDEIESYDDAFADDNDGLLGPFKNAYVRRAITPRPTEIPFALETEPSALLDAATNAINVDSIPRSEDSEVSGEDEAIQDVAEIEAKASTIIQEEESHEQLGDDVQREEEYEEVATDAHSFYANPSAAIVERQQHKVAQFAADEKANDVSSVAGVLPSTTGGDIEDLVNMLEPGVSTHVISGANSVAGSDVAGVIPDEE